MLDILVAQIRLQGPGIMALVRQGEAAGVSKHVRMGLELQPGSLSSPLDHAGKAGRGERCSPFRCEHERRFGILLALQPTQSTQFIATDRMRAGRALLDPRDRQGCRIEVDLIPAQVYQLACPKPVPVRHQGSLSNPDGPSDWPWPPQ